LDYGTAAYLWQEMTQWISGLFKSPTAEYGLNGVDTLFGKDLPGYQPELCIAPDIRMAAPLMAASYPQWRKLVGNE